MPSIVPCVQCCFFAVPAIIQVENLEAIDLARYNGQYEYVHSLNAWDVFMMYLGDRDTMSAACESTANDSQSQGSTLTVAATAHGSASHKVPRVNMQRFSARRHLACFPDCVAAFSEWVDKHDDAQPHALVALNINTGVLKIYSSLEEVRGSPLLTASGRYNGLEIIDGQLRRQDKTVIAEWRAEVRLELEDEDNPAPKAHLRCIPVQRRNAKPSRIVIQY